MINRIEQTNKINYQFNNNKQQNKQKSKQQKKAFINCKANTTTEQKEFKNVFNIELKKLDIFI